MLACMTHASLPGHRLCLPRQPGRSMTDVSARDPEEFSVGQWPDWSLWKSKPDSLRARGRGRVAFATAMAVASLTLIARAEDIAHGTGPPLLTSLAIGLVACYGIGCVLAPWFESKRRCAGGASPSWP